MTTLAQMQGISLSEMDGIKLMNRIDSKYVTTEAVLGQILERCVSSFRVLETSGGRLASYDTVYYDTDDLKMYFEHHNRRLDREKIRVRRYCDTGECFIELKHKNNHGRTRKKRRQIDPSFFPDCKSCDEALRFIAAKSRYRLEDTSPAVRTRFSRITLTNNNLSERITIDSKLCFDNFRTGRSSTLDDAVIIEIKQDSHASSLMKSLLLDLRVKRLRLSKACVGTVLTNAEVKNSRFKEKLRAVGKMTGKRYL